MLRSGRDYLESLRDGRVIYVGGERIDDVTRHAAFRNAAHTVASIYDFKAAPANRALMSVEADGERVSAYYLRARNRADLETRSRAHRAIADLTFGMMGRSPDHVASFVTGMSTNPGAFGPFADNLERYYRHMRSTDTYTVYAIIPPHVARNPAFYASSSARHPALRVVREADDGVVISGMKTLATGAVLANEIWIGNMPPLGPDQADQSITCAVPVNAPGLSLWSRKPFERGAGSALDSPLSHRFDETDSMVICDEVKVPWERVFVHNDTVRARGVYLETPGHCYGNHQSNVRFAAKLGLLVGLAARVARVSGADQLPAVRDTLGRLAAAEAMLSAMIEGQIHAAEDWPAGFATFNRRYMYAALNWCTENHSGLIDTLRELCSGAVFQVPADVSIFSDPALAETFESYWTAPDATALDRMKLYKLAWEVIGSDFAGRHQQYEKFYAGAGAVVRGYNHAQAPWDRFDATLGRLLDDPAASWRAAAE